jgi:hypothetical protein
MEDDEKSGLGDESGVFRYVCICCMSNCKNVVRICFVFELIDFYYFCMLSGIRDGRCSCR